MTDNGIERAEKAVETLVYGTVGLAMYVRDTAPFVAHGVNATVWTPSKEAADSEVDGLALGLPVTGAGRVRGLAIGLGVGATETLDGVSAGVLGLGSGGGLRGVHLAGSWADDVALPRGPPEHSA